MMSDLPVMLRVEGRRCVVVGGGGVALRRARELRGCGAEVVVIAPGLVDEIKGLGVRVEERGYQRGDLEGAWLVVTATDDEGVNEVVAEEAAGLGVLVNRADLPGASGRGDVTVGAHAHHGPVTIAVHTSGVSAGAAAAIRRELSEALDPDWVRLLEVVRPYRGLICQRYPNREQRRALLKRLTGPGVLDMLKERGLEGLEGHCKKLLDEAVEPISGRVDTDKGPKKDKRESRPACPTD